MSRLIIEGGRPLRGSVDISGAKNSALAIVVAAALATEGECVLDNIPQGSDVSTICQILQELGVDIWYDDQQRLHVRGETLSKYQASYELVRRMRASFYSAGLLLARLGRAEVPLPGGCAIGSRPVDYHIKGFSQLGAEVVIEHGYMKAETKRLKGAHIYVNRASVGTTINLMIAASLAEGTTVLENAAKEPEVVDLAIFLNGMGARVRGAGTESIRIDGVDKLRGIEYSIIPDRIEAGTFILATAITGGDVVLKNVVAEHLRVPIVKMEEAGVRITRSGTELRVEAPRRLKSVDVETLPYPGFPTDLQQPFVAAMCVADGTSVVRETIFDRFRYVDELRRMGADIKTEQNTAIVRGVPQLTGAPVEITDLRAGAALAIAALAAQGRTELHSPEIIDRGYEYFEEKLRALGANIYREQLTSPRELVST
ncbi:MAG: UDP-N-acetylglucosamine 1-carboxyvinyltransferase [Limnochordia bacterium]|jgi:UDP-N-acetylglucosamine 1-carboxyvinyltransferase|nr:UDP-N-acetylglucosamine 1-carboxyvinyltransferase [Bacillota bacterium]NLL07567.1 UDP-N-acetylglucosamine 1-carboxyvinyltransferase [Bacillota bacterium]HBG08522.1 UDP-N-acetylglucosamine 1-carboxyvinyltransferase [Bacillota bacterium]